MLLTMRPLVLLFVVSFALGSLLTTADAAATKSNIILIYSDDHGFADLRAQGVDKDIQTPNLDALAREGVRFKRGYVSAPQCVPSRAGVITGRYQQRFGVEDNTLGPLPLAEVTIAERLKPAGYISGQIGKWHLEPAGKRAGEKQDARQFLPLGQGFEEYYTGPLHSFVASHDLKGNRLPDAPKTLTDARFRCVWQTEAALSFLDRRAQNPEKPFFLYLAYFTPHVPLESPEPWFSKTPEHLPKERRQALAMIAGMDDGIGRIREKLRLQGQEKNTLIFFISDNGAPLKEGAWNGSLNLPLTGEKGMLTDGGVRTPFLAVWPGTLPAGKVFEPPVINLDVAATAAALAGLPHDASLDGVNLMPYLLGNKMGNPHEALYWRWRSQAAILADGWKLILLGKERFLFKPDEPEGETKNLLKEFPGKAAELEKKLMAWNATLPPPSLPRELNAQDQIFYDAHVLKTGKTVVKRPRGAKGEVPADAGAEAKSLQGWLGRNCELMADAEGLHVTPAKKGQPFLARSGLGFTGPVVATLRIQCPAGGKGGISWRLEGQKDFVPAQHQDFDIPAASGWQTLKFPVPAEGRVIHVRLHLPGSRASVLGSLEFQGPGNERAIAWRFDQPQP